MGVEPWNKDGHETRDSPPSFGNGLQVGIAGWDHVFWLVGINKH